MAESPLGSLEQIWKLQAALNARGIRVGGCRAPMGAVDDALLAPFLAALDVYDAFEH